MIKPGAAPQSSTAAALPPMVNWQLAGLPGTSSDFKDPVETAGTPSNSGEFFGPNPLAHSWYCVPAETAHSPAHPNPVTQAMPFVKSFRNIDGDAAAAMVMGSTLLSTPFRVTLIFTANPGFVSQGIWKLICVAEM